MSNFAFTSFKNDKKSASYCFEISSEGELEQIRPLLIFFLTRNDLVELIYSSPSVEKKCLELWHAYRDNLRLLRLPLITFPWQQSVSRWSTAVIFIFCRYDFFPELLLLFNKKKFVLISGAVKKKERILSFGNWYKENAFKLFRFVVAATQNEKKQFQNILAKSTPIDIFDFRIVRIFERLKLAEKKLAGVQNLEFQNLLAKIKSIKAGNESIKKTLILGNYWESDLPVLNHHGLIDDVREGRLFLLIVPHKLDASHLTKISKGLVALFGVEGRQKIAVLNMSGVLCELYSLFDVAYVGGGYERSVHSCFEPFFAGCKVVLGPMIRRSTEYDFIYEICPNEIEVLKTPHSLYNILKDYFWINPPDRNIRISWEHECLNKMQNIIDKIISL